MRDALTRDIVVLDTMISADPAYAPRRKLSDIVGRIAGLPPDEQAQWRRNKSFKTHLRDIEFEKSKRWVKFLVCINDKDMPGASFAEMETDEQRDIEKEAGEGRPLTSHVLMSLVPYKDDRNRYITLLEQGISRAGVQAFFNSLLRAVAKASPEDFKHPSPSGAKGPDGKIEKYKYKNMVEFLGHPSSDFEEAIKGGKINGVALQTHNKQIVGTGDGDLIIPRRQDLQLSAKKGWNLESLTAARKLGKQRKYEAARIAFQSSDGTSHSTELDVTTGLILGDGFTQTHRISGMGIFLPEASLALESPLVKKMESWLIHYVNEVT
jgi:hypothetical protein